MVGEARRALIGVYRPPVVQLGDWLHDEIDGRVEVGGYSDGPVPWPRRLKTGRPSLILCGDLVRAVRTESAVAIAHHFGVGSVTVSKWRVALGVDRQNNEGTQSLYRGTAVAGSSAPTSSGHRGGRADLLREATGQTASDPSTSAEDTTPMPRPAAGYAATSAQRKTAMRRRKAQRGEVRCSVDLTHEAREIADRAAEAAGTTRTEFINGLILRCRT